MLYRAFRRERGPQLETMIKVLRVLGLELAVKYGAERGQEALQMQTLFVLPLLFQVVKLIRYSTPSPRAYAHKKPFRALRVKLTARARPSIVSLRVQGRPDLVPFDFF